MIYDSVFLHPILRASICVAKPGARHAGLQSLRRARRTSLQVPFDEALLVLDNGCLVHMGG